MANSDKTASHGLVILSSVNPALMSIAIFSASDEGVTPVTIRISWPEDDYANPYVIFEEQLGIIPGKVVQMELAAECITCALREAIVDYLQTCVALDPHGITVLGLPPSVELAHLCPSLSESIAEEVAGAVMLGVAHCIDSEEALTMLAEHTPLSDWGSGLTQDDTRCAGELHVANMAYADATWVFGQDSAGAELVSHLVPADSLLIPGVDAEAIAALSDIRHDPEEALRRAHPATAQAGGGTVVNNTWTLDLYSDRPFHPVRLRELVDELGRDGCVARGCFWLPSRPDRVCLWESIGRMVTVGDGGKWHELPSVPQWDGPRCHLIVTGCGTSGEAEEIRRAFGQIVMSESEMPDALAWVGADDGLGDWFGQS